ncbi:helix-turn-helix domain-containing protein, partial [Bordetella pertussis]
ATPGDADAPAFNAAERAERERVLAALEANGWRRQDTAHHLGISRKVLWEKMRKLRLGEAQAETADGVADP